MEEIIDPDALTAISAPKLFQCSLCTSAFTRNASRHRHYRKVHKILNTLKHPVDVPMEEFGANGEQRAPPASVHITPQLYYSCLICAKSFTTKGSRDRHFRNIHNRDENAKKEPEQNLFHNYQCDICGEEFMDETIFLNHKSLHSTDLLRMEQNDHMDHESPAGDIVNESGNSVYECEICERVFSTNRSRARHYWLVHNGARTLEQAKEMSLTEPKSPPPPTVEDSDDETKHKFPCSICSNSYATNSSRVRHIRTVHNGVIVMTKGPRVNKKRRAGRNGKIKIKTDLNPYKIYYPCDICGCVFTRNFTRERHYQTIHNGKRHYIEVHSGVQDGSSANATQSKSVVVKSHQTSYPCIICKKIYFATNESRERHYKNVHNGAKLVSTIDTRDKYTPKGYKINYPCVICDVVFTRKQQLDRHYREAHNGNRSLRIEKGCSGRRSAAVVTIDNGFQCDACGEVFDSHLFLVRHKSTKPQDMNGELQAHAAGSSASSALQVITDDSQSFVVTYVNDDENGGGHIGAVNGGHISAVNKQLPAVGLKFTKAMAKKYRCAICRRFFSSIGNRQRHYQTMHHNGVRKLKKAPQVAVKNESVESIVIDDDEPGESFFVKGEPEEILTVDDEPKESFSVEDVPVESFASLHEPEVSFIVQDEPIESFTIEDDPIESLAVEVEPGESLIVNRTSKKSTSVRRKPNRKRSAVKRRTSAKSSKSGAFACDVCHDIFTTNSSCKRHWEAIHNKDRETFPCGICENSSFSTNASRRRHYRTIHKRNFNDDLLGSNAEEEEILPLKLKPNVTCDICHDIFTTNSSLKRHWEAIHNKESQTFACGICENSVFSTNGSRLRHYRTVHNSEFKGDSVGSNAEEEALPLKLKPLKTKQPATFPCAICKASFTRKGTRERHYRTIHDGAQTVDEIVKRGMMLSVTHMRHFCDTCGDAFDSKLMLESHKSSEHATNKDIPNAAFFAVAELNDQINSEVAIKQEKHTALDMVKEEYAVYEKSSSQEIVSDNLENEEDSDDEPANNSYLNTTEKWQYI